MFNMDTINNYKVLKVNVNIMSEKVQDSPKKTKNTLNMMQFKNMSTIGKWRLQLPVENSDDIFLAFVQIKAIYNAHVYN